MADDLSWFAGLDWASEGHRACLLDSEGTRVGERDFTHDGVGLTELCNWLLTKSGASAATVAVAIETPRGPVVEALLERGFAMFSINPKQLDRFRDRFTMAGAKDDSRDAQVLASSLRSDRRAFRRLSVDDPLVIELREWTRIHEELTQERSRLANRVRDQLWRYYPQARNLTDDLAADWFLDLWQQVPRRHRQRARTRRQSGVSSSSTGFAASMPLRCCAFCASSRSRLHPEPPRPPARTFVRLRRVCD